MKLLYLHQFFTTPTMDGGTRSYEMARRLVTMGHHVHMVCADSRKAGSMYTTDEAGIMVTWIPVPYSNSMNDLARIRAFVRFAVLATVVAAKSRCDVVFATSTPLTIAIPAIVASRLRRVPMVFEVRDLWPEMPIAVGVLKDPVSKFLARALESIAYRSSKHIVALSPGMKQGIVATGYPEQYVTVIPNGCDIGMFSIRPECGLRFRSEQSWLGDRPLVTYAGTLGRINDVSYLVRLAYEVQKLRTDVRFLIVGEGQETEKVRAIATQLGVLNTNLFMMGAVPKADVPAILSASTIAVSLFRNIVEMQVNSANKFFDALASATPIAINYGGWQADLLIQSQAGIVLDPVNIPEAARTLVATLNDRDWLESAGQSARQVGIAQFDRNELARRLDRVLTEVRP